MIILCGKEVEEYDSKIRRLYRVTSYKKLPSAFGMLRYHGVYLQKDRQIEDIYNQMYISFILILDDAIYSSVDSDMMWNFFPI